jgi:hypothetical protein
MLFYFLSLHFLFKSFQSHLPVPVPVPVPYGATVLEVPWPPSRQISIRLFSEPSLSSPTNGVSTLSWWWGLRVPMNPRAKPAVA